MHTKFKTLNKNDSNLKISILIVTYNQSEVIGRAIESILIQKKYGLFKIVICDDCSTDNNWDVINDYYSKFPEIISIHRNTKNLGIYGNCNNIINLREKSDLYYILSGDDALCDGVLNEIQTFALNNNLKNCQESYSIYCDWMSITPNNIKNIHRNDIILSRINPISLKHRNLISNRSVFISDKVISQFKPVPTDMGLSLAEELFDRQYQLFSSKNFYCSFVGSVYYTNIGVSTKLHNQDYYKENILTSKTVYNIFCNKLNGKDYYYSLYIQSIYDYLYKPTLRKLFKILKYYIKSFIYIRTSCLLNDLKNLLLLSKKVFY